MATYICKIWSNTSHEREYTVTTTSALKAATEYGHCEGGEVVQIYRKCGTLIAEARYTPEDGGKYYRVQI